MTLRRWVATILFLLAAVGLLWYGLRDLKRDEQAARARAHSAPTAASPPASTFSREVPTIRATENLATGEPADGGAAPVVGTLVPPPPPTSASATAPLAPGTSSEIEPQLDQLNLALRDFRTLAGENPVGTNAEITKALLGDNPNQASLLAAGTARNAEGELIDAWGTPYFFHQISGREMEIRSAGPDRQLWTEDDQTKTSGTGESGK